MRWLWRAASIVGWSPCMACGASTCCRRAVVVCAAGAVQYTNDIDAMCYTVAPEHIAHHQGENAMQPEVVVVIDVVVKTFAPFVPHIATLIALIVVDIITGIASAIRRGAFSWSRVGNFYRTSVVPQLMGFVSITGATAFVAPSLLGPDAGAVVSQGSGWGFWIAAVAAIVSSIKSNVDELSKPLPSVEL